MAHFGSLDPHKENLPKNVIFHDFFKLLLNLGGLGWSCRYVEMFLGPLEDVLNRKYILIPYMIHNRKCNFHPQNAPLPQYWGKAAFWGENYISYCESYTDLKCTLCRLIKPPSPVRKFPLSRGGGYYRFFFLCIFL